MLHEWVIQRNENGWHNFDVLIAKTRREAYSYLVDKCREEKLNLREFRIGGRSRF